MPIYWWTTGGHPGICSGPQRIPEILDETFLKIVTFTVQKLCKTTLVVDDLPAYQSRPSSMFLKRCSMGQKMLRTTGLVYRR